VTIDAPYRQQRCAALWAAWFFLTVNFAASIAVSQPTFRVPDIAGDTLREVTFSEAVGSAAQTRPELQRIRFAIAEIESQEGSSASVFEPLFGAELNLRRAEAPVNDGLGSGVNISERWDVSMSLAKRFPLGTTLTGTFRSGVSRTVFPLSTAELESRIVRGPNVETSLALQATQPLLRGRGRAVNLLPAVLAARTRDARVAELQRELSAGALEIFVVFAELSATRQQYEQLRRSLTRTERQIEIANAELRAGRIAPIELDLVHQRLAANQEALLVNYAQLRTRSRELSRLMGIDPLQDTWMLPSALPSIPIPSRNHGLLCDMARSSSLEVEAARRQLEVARTDLQRTSDGLSPSLDLTAGIVQSGLDERFGPSYGQVFGLQATTIFGGLVFQLPLGNLAARGEHERAQMAVDRAAYEVDVIARSLCFELTESIAQLELAEERLEIAHYRVAIAERAQEAEEARFAQGLSTVQLGIDALENLDQIEADVLQIEVEIALTEARIAHVIGVLAAYVDVEVAYDR